MRATRCFGISTTTTARSTWRGETWTFLGHNFLPHDDGLSLFVSLDGDREWHIRLQWRDDQQGPLIDRLEDYIRKAA